MKKFAATVALGLAGMVVFTACGPESGTVYAKEFTPARDWTTQGGYAYTCMPGFDGKMDCKYKYSPYVVEHHHEDQCYALYFKDDEGNKGEDCVPQSTYDSTDIGDFYSKE